ncbi:hypothetical protein ACIRST_41335 [Kitasatospora sp. NPDC101447]|uniref:hypothetical protein n=1 Tax=Kitasatospora sp. NPDC101447 TaxID=3364102 RepID=UPI0037F24B86
MADEPGDGMFDLGTSSAVGPSTHNRRRPERIFSIPASGAASSRSSSMRIDGYEQPADPRGRGEDIAGIGMVTTLIG